MWWDQLNFVYYEWLKPTKTNNWRKNERKQGPTMKSTVNHKGFSKYKTKFQIFAGTINSCSTKTNWKIWMF